jgi:hypothetical protein
MGEKMKKFFVILTSMLLLLTLVGCVKLDTIKDRFSDAQYTYSANGSTLITSLMSGFEEDGITVTAHVFSSGLKTAIVLEFESTKEMQAELEENNTLMGFIEDLEEEKIVQDNFLLIPIGLSETDIQQMIDIFNGDYEPTAKA